MKILLAPWVLPISREPIEQGAVVIEADKIAAVGSEKEILTRFTGEVQRFPHSALMPALVNAHVHLELSGFRGRIPGDGSFVSWVERLIQLRRNVAAIHEESHLAQRESPLQIEKDIRTGIDEAKNSGTGLVGEISNSALSYPLLHQSELYATFFLEVLSFQQDKAVPVFEAAQKLLQDLPSSPRILKTLAPHAPFTVSPALFSLLEKYLTAHKLPGSFHLGESPEEAEFLRSGTGPLKTLLEKMEAWEPGWQAPQKSPLEYWQHLHPSPAMMLVHLTQLKGQDIKKLASGGGTICICPRSNAHIGVGRPDIETMLAEGLTPALGTDSLASNEDLNLFAEMAYVKKNFKVPGRLILKMATRWGARALGWGDVWGSLEAGKIARIIAVKIEGGKPEEALTAGIGPQEVSWA